MSRVEIENPVLNSPYAEPMRHFRFADDGITDEIVPERRKSSYFVPIPSARKKGGTQGSFETQWTQDRVEYNEFINRVRDRVSSWRGTNREGITPVTRQLLDHWLSTDRARPMFFCQVEALETVIYMTEVAPRFGSTWIENELRLANAEMNPELFRVALKMATGSGKTLVMAMIIAWQALNKLRYPQDARFSDAFLVVSPGITVRDRLRVLMPSDPENYYRKYEIVPSDLMEQIQQAKVVVTNFHQLQLREHEVAARLTKKILRGDSSVDPFCETPDQMARRVCRGLGNKKKIIVLNDEAHHCYRPKVDIPEGLTGDERKEAKDRNNEARVWLSGLEAINRKIGIRTVYDLSATPFFLSGSGYKEGSLFPWVVSDFSLIDAIESGIVKVPRVPISDNSMEGATTKYRDLWLSIRDHLPKKGRKTDEVTGEPKLPVILQGALHSLYSNYEKAFQLWEQNEDARKRGRTPPVLIVVCNNTNVSKLVYDYIAGWEKQIDGQTIVQSGQLPIFRNDDGAGRWLNRPNTILVDSQQLESGSAMSDDFKKLATREIEEFKADYIARFPGRDAESLTDEDLLREVMNTVGKAGKLGEQVRCVVSVSMLTEGWDANTVTHILGVRAFGTQLLCEQVVGRALRRTSYAVNEHGLFEPEYAEVYGVPFSFIPCNGSAVDPQPGPQPTRVRALEDRIECEIKFPRLAGYRYDLQDGRLVVSFRDEHKLVLSTKDLPTRTDIAPIVGESAIHTLDDLKRKRPNEIAFQLAKRILEKYFQDDDGNNKPWLFPQMLAIARRWLDECLTLKDDTFPQMLLLIEFQNAAADLIYRAVASSTTVTPTVVPIMRPYDFLGSTRGVEFTTTRPVYSTSPDKCHISHVVADTDSWEQKMAESLESMPEVVRYVKNHNLGFTIPYTIDGEQKNYIPDFIACIDDGNGAEDLLNLIVEVTGEKRADKAIKVSTAQNLWVPAVNNHGGFGRWKFIEIEDPWNAKNVIRAALRKDTNR